MARGGKEIGLPREVRDDLEAAGVVPGRPLVAIDCDEVIVEFAGHLARWLGSVGYEMRLEAYRLEGAIFPAGGSVPVEFDAALRLIDAFFEEETIRQTPLPGAVEAIGRIAAAAQVVILTNIPRHAREARIGNLQAMGIAAPVIANSGGKGRALAWLADRAAAPSVFIDDSAQQIASAAKHAPGVGRVYFAGSPYIAAVLPHSAEAHARVDGWETCETEVMARLRG